MQQDLQTQILAVTGRAARSGRPMWDVQVADQTYNGGKFSLFEPNEAAKANSFVAPPGQVPQTVTVRVEQKGKYWNFIDVFPAGAAPPLVQGIVTDASNGGGYGAPPPIQASPQGGGEDAAVAARISRQNANTAAASLIGALYHGAGPELLGEAVQKFQKLAREMAGFGQQGVFADVSQGATQTPSPQTPQQVADVVNAEAPGAVVVGAQPTPQEQQAGDVEWT